MEHNCRPDLLESFPTRNPQGKGWVSFLCTEFTSVCPKTNWPDFARIFVNYIPAEKMLESKSMKLYLGSFRNHGAYHEDCVEKILSDLVALLRPHYVEVMGEFTVRGGIAIWPYFNYANEEEQEFRQLSQQRRRDYAPGKYSGKPF